MVNLERLSVCELQPAAENHPGLRGKNNNNTDKDECAAGMSESFRGQKRSKPCRMEITEAIVDGCSPEQSVHGQNFVLLQSVVVIYFLTNSWFCLHSFFSTPLVAKQTFCQQHDSGR